MAEEVTNQSVIDYLSKMYGTEYFDELVAADQNNIIFSAMELLKDRFEEKDLTNRAVALQVLYMLEGDAEEFSKLKRHGVQSYSIKGVSVTFDGDLISPMVVSLLEPTKGASTGRLI